MGLKEENLISSSYQVRELLLIKLIKIASDFTEEVREFPVFQVLDTIPDYLRSTTSSAPSQSRRVASSSSETRWSQGSPAQPPTMPVLAAQRRRGILVTLQGSCLFNVFLCRSPIVCDSFNSPSISPLPSGDDSQKVKIDQQ